MNLPSFCMFLLMTLAAVLQLVTIRNQQIQYHIAAIAAKRIMAAGFIILAIRFLDSSFSYFDLTNRYVTFLGIILLAIGSIAMNIDRIHCSKEERKNRRHETLSTT